MGRWAPTEVGIAEVAQMDATTQMDAETGLPGSWSKCERVSGRVIGWSGREVMGLKAAFSQQPTTQVESEVGRLAKMI